MVMPPVVLRQIQILHDALPSSGERISNIAHCRRGVSFIIIIFF